MIPVLEHCRDLPDPLKSIFKNLCRRGLVDLVYDHQTVVILTIEILYNLEKVPKIE